MLKVFWSQVSVLFQTSCSGDFNERKIWSILYCVLRAKMNLKQLDLQFYPPPKRNYFHTTTSFHPSPPFKEMSNPSKT